MPNPPAVLSTAVVGVGARAPIARHAVREGAELVAAVDPDPRAAARARDLFGDIPVYPDVAALLAAHPGLDTAIVTSPDHTHADVTVELLGGGAGVYLEKPLATTAADADRVLRAAYETGSKLYVGHNMRHMHVVRLMRQIVRRGEIGEVKAIWCRHFVGHGGDYYFKDWHAERAKSTGLLLQKGAHDIDVIHWLAGGVSREVVAMGDLTVYDKVGSRRDNTGATMRDWFSYDNWPPLEQRDLNPVIDVEDISMMTMRLDNGVLASYQQCHYTPDYWRNYTVIGTEGRLENFGDGAGGRVVVWRRRGDFRPDGDAAYPITGDDGHGDADVRTMTEFLRAVREDAPTETDPVAAREAVLAGIAATTSLRIGSAPQRIEPIAAPLAEYFAAHQPRTRVPRLS